MKKGLKSMAVVSIIIASVLMILNFSTDKGNEESNDVVVNKEVVVPDTTSTGKYEKFIINNANEMSDTYYDLTEHLDSLNYSESWVIKMTILIEKIRDLTDEVILYDLDDVPYEYEEMHELYLLGAIEHNNAMYLFVEGFNDSDSDLIEESFESMSKGNEYVREAKALLKESNEM